MNTATAQYKAGDAAAKLWFLLSLIWFPIFATIGFLMAVKFFFPQFLTSEIWLSFGRIRPAHVNGVLFGFVSSGLLGSMFWIVPRLCAAPLYRPTLAKLAAILWNGAIVAGIIWILLGGSQGREYAELPWVIDVAVMATLLLMAYIVFGTLKRRKEKKLYVSLWYYAGTMLWFPIVYFIGNVMWSVPDGALSGVRDAIFNWYYGHNVLGLWFTTLGIPAWYFFIPRIIKKPLYSHMLSLIAFFTIAFFYTGVGAHHLLQAPIAEWLKTMAVVMSILMLIPVFTFATNILLTMRGSWYKLKDNVALQFIMGGFIMYVVASLQGSFQAFRDTNAYLHFSQWPVGHAHLALLGGFGFLVVGATYYFVPMILGKRIYSDSLSKLSFWVATIGFSIFFTAMTMAGLVANANWWEHIGVVETLPALKPYFVLRAIGGGSVIVAAFIFAINLILTFTRSKQPFSEPAEERLTASTATDSSKAYSPLQKASQEKLSLSVISLGGLTMFIIMTFMVVAMPYMFGKNEPTARAHELTPIELKGQALYKSMGCFYCHSQFTRPQDWASGETSELGDFYYSQPAFLGTERTGPNLAQIGGKLPVEWEIQHYKNPQSLSPSSVMPSFAFLADNDLEALAAYVGNLGGENLDTQSFQPLVPVEYQDKTNPNLELMAQIQKDYNADTQEFAGSDAAASQWSKFFEEGKQLFAEKCLRCHGCSANGQGPYARNVVTRPANLNERISNYPDPVDPFQYWRISQGVPGTAMPPWHISLSEDTIWKIATYELSFVDGSLRTVAGSVSDQEGDDFAGAGHNQPLIAGTQAEFASGKALYELYCAQCHGIEGHGDGPASSTTPGGYINPQPANFEESGADFKLYGRYLWKVTEGVETVNMIPWKYVLSQDEIFRTILYIQSFSKPDDYNAKWAPLYSDAYARNLMK